MIKATKFIGRFLLFLTLYFLFGCTKDVFEETFPKEKNAMFIERLSFEQLQHNTTLLQKLKTIDVSKMAINAKRKAGAKSSYDFVIDTDGVVHIRKGSYESYTFPIYRSGETSDIEHLVLSSKNKGDT